MKPISTKQRDTFFRRGLFIGGLHNRKIEWMILNPFFLIFISRPYSSRNRPREGTRPLGAMLKSILGGQSLEYTKSF
jgi:hypothetical protein